MNFMSKSWKNSPDHNSLSLAWPQMVLNYPIFTKSNKFLFEIGLDNWSYLIWDCGSRNQSVLAVSHWDAITINMLGELNSNNRDCDQKIYVLVWVSK